MWRNVKPEPLDEDCNDSFELVDYYKLPKTCLSVKRKKNQCTKEDSDEEWNNSKTTWKCVKCTKIFTSNKKYKTHQKNCDNESSNSSEEPPRQKRKSKRSWPCTKCDEKFSTILFLRAHRKIHVTENEQNDTKYNYKFETTCKVFSCNTCDAEFPDEEDMKKHALTHEEVHTCNECGAVFNQPYKFACHMYVHNGRMEYNCPLCIYKTPRRPNLLTHINMAHFHKFTHHCNVCGKGFNDRRLHHEHRNVHEGVKPFTCVVCNKDFPFTSYLITHQKRNHKVVIEGVTCPNQCRLCCKNFAKPQSLENHMVVHNAGVHPKIHLCDTCGKGFSSKCKLKVHTRVHTGIKPYECSYCDKSFIKKDYLVIHERVHSGEKPYSCEYCGKCFNQGAPLRIHVRSHTGERPYVCHICKAGFISKGVLTLHFKSCPGNQNLL